MHQGNSSSFAIEVISVTDEALDVAAMPPGQLARYIETRDIALVKPYFLFGQKPTIYRLREIPHRIFQSVREQTTETARLSAAFQAALVRVENLRSEDGALLNLGPEMGRYDNGVLRDEELERFEASELDEIGEVAFTRTFFRRKTVRVYQLPRSLRERWASQAALRAVPSPASPDTSNSAASSGSPADTARSSATTSGPQTNDSSSGSPTAATAPDGSPRSA